MEKCFWRVAGARVRQQPSYMIQARERGRPPVACLLFAVDTQRLCSAMARSWSVDLITIPISPNCTIRRQAHGVILVVYRPCALAIGQLCYRMARSSLLLAIAAATTEFSGPRKFTIRRAEP